MPKILAIETSCDETAISVVEFEEKGGEVSGHVLSHLISSQIEMHKEWGGVVPNIAKREHQKALIPLLKQALAEANLLVTTPQNIHPNKLENVGVLEKILNREPELLTACQDFLPTIDAPAIDAIAVTTGPGLEPALWVGINFAKALATIWQKPLIPVNHMEGHLFSALLKKDGKSEARNSKHENGLEFRISDFEFPLLALLISGGHTELVLMEDWQKYKLLGATRDDAIGEAFDKVARLLGLPYPGGPEISRLAEKFSANYQLTTSNFRLPRPMINSDDFDFSFSGIKTAVRYLVEKLPQPLTEEQKIAIAYEFEEAVTEVVVSKTLRAVKETNAKTFVVGGGVIANKKIRAELQKQISEQFPEVHPVRNTGDKNLAKKVSPTNKHQRKSSQILDGNISNGVKIYIPDQELTTDNATMIAIAAYFRAKSRKDILTDSTEFVSIKASGTLAIHN